jgi:K+ transporter
VFLLTTLLVTVLAVSVWEISLLAVVPLASAFLLIEGAFVSANLIKVTPPAASRLEPSATLLSVAVA